MIVHDIRPPRPFSPRRLPLLSFACFAMPSPSFHAFILSGADIIADYRSAYEDAHEKICLLSEFVAAARRPHRPFRHQRASPSRFDPRRRGATSQYAMRCVR